jgi:predicted nucleotidyltransferase
MDKKTPSATGYIQPYRYPSPGIPLAAIKRFARKIAAKFHPDKIVLFGSYAKGQPHEESDVDLLVIMPTRNAIDESIRIGNAFDEWPFALDLIVRTPRHIERGLRDGDWFLTEVIQTGVVLYESYDRPVDSQSRGRLAQRSKPKHSAAASTGSGLLPLSTRGRKLPQGSSARSKRRRTSDT